MKIFAKKIDIHSIADSHVVQREPVFAAALLWNAMSKLM